MSVVYEHLPLFFEMILAPATSAAHLLLLRLPPIYSCYVCRPSTPATHACRPPTPATHACRPPTPAVRTTCPRPLPSLARTTCPCLPLLPSSRPVMHDSCSTSVVWVVTALVGWSRRLQPPRRASHGWGWWGALGTPPQFFSQLFNKYSGSNFPNHFSTIQQIFRK